jgi:hypothetical protein
MAVAFASATNSVQELQRKLANSRFFMVSMLVHVLIVVWLGGTVLYQRVAETPDFTGDPGEGFVQATPEAQPPVQQQAPSFEVSAPANTAPSMSAITTTNTSVQPSFALPAPVTLTQNLNTRLTDTAVAPPQVSNAPPGKIPGAVAAGIAGFVSGWSAPGSGGPGTSLRERRFKFTAYLAKYGDPSDKKRGGDWASTNRIRDGKIVFGSLPNLLYVIGKLSRDKIDAQPEAIPLDLTSKEIFAKKPPFIFFTGHRDFVLTDEEVANLQEYIKLGGCIWGDSSLPGKRSRFDIAFRREMRRVIPDKDKEFEALPPDHEIFTKAYYPEIKEVPPGINYYREPVYALKYYDEVAVLYTANDYGDMWQIGLDEKGQVDLRRDENGTYVAVNDGIWSRAGIYFRNVEQKSILDSYKFGTNIIVHLLTRWEDKVRNVPRGL